MRWWQIRKRDEDLERELRSDLDLEKEEQIESGLSPKDAHYAARRAFGNPAWEAAPGTRIEMPALTSEVARLADRNSELVEIAEEEINEFRDHAETYADDEILGLARIAASALVDRGRTFHGREEAIRYRLAFPTGAYYTWKGSVLEGTPIEPDQSIAFDWREARHGHDRQLKHSIKLLENTPTQLSFREA